MSGYNLPDNWSWRAYYEWNGGACPHDHFITHPDGTKECSDCGETEGPED